jgi:hypothetical protein
MKVFAHVRADGSIQGLVAVPDGKQSAMLTPAPGIQVCEVADHGIKGETVDLDQLGELLKKHTVMITPAQGKLLRRKA